MDKNFGEIAKKMLETYEKNKEKIANSYQCWDCDKLLGDLGFSDEQKKSPRTLEGHYNAICKECGEKE